MIEKDKLVLIHYPNGIDYTWFRNELYDTVFVLNQKWCSGICPSIIRTVEITEDQSEIWTEYAK